MALIPRKDEIEAVLGVIGPTPEELNEMQQEDKEEVVASARQASKDVLKVAWDALRRRTWYAILHDYGGARILFGPESSTSAAEKWILSNLNGGSAGIVTVHPVGVHEEWLRGQELEWDKRRNNRCLSCGHQQWAHEFTNFNGKKITRPSRSLAPCGTSCMCPEYRK